jgi:hypothetical protein
VRGYLKYLPIRSRFFVSSTIVLAIFASQGVRRASLAVDPNVAFAIFVVIAVPAIVWMFSIMIYVHVARTLEDRALFTEVAQLGTLCGALVFSTTLVVYICIWTLPIGLFGRAK